MIYDYENKYVFPYKKHGKKKHHKRPRHDYHRGLNPWDYGGRCPHSPCPYDYGKEYDYFYKYRKW